MVMADLTDPRREDVTSVAITAGSTGVGAQEKASQLARNASWHARQASGHVRVLERDEAARPGAAARARPGRRGAALAVARGSERRRKSDGAPAAAQTQAGPAFPEAGLRRGGEPSEHAGHGRAAAALAHCLHAPTNKPPTSRPARIDPCISRPRCPAHRPCRRCACLPRRHRHRHRHRCCRRCPRCRPPAAPAPASPLRAAMSLPRSRAASTASAAASTGSRPSLHAERHPVPPPPSFPSDAPASAASGRHAPGPPPMSLPPPPAAPCSQTMPASPATAPHAFLAPASASYDTPGPPPSPYAADMSRSPLWPAPGSGSVRSPTRTLISPERGLFSRSTGSLHSYQSSVSSSPTPSLLPPSPLTPGMPASPPPVSPSHQSPGVCSKDHPSTLRSSTARFSGPGSARSSTDESAQIWPPDFNTRSAWSVSTHPAQPLDPPDRSQTLRPNDERPIPVRSTTVTPARPSLPQGGVPSEPLASTMLLAHSPEPVHTSLIPTQPRSGQVPLGDELAWLINAYSSERGSAASDQAMRSAHSPVKLQPSLSPVPSHHNREMASSLPLTHGHSLNRLDGPSSSWMQKDYSEKEVDQAHDSGNRDSGFERLPSPNAGPAAAPYASEEEASSFYDVDLHADQESVSAQPSAARLISHRASGSTSLHPSLHRLAQLSSGNESGHESSVPVDLTGREGSVEQRADRLRKPHGSEEHRHPALALSTTEFDHVHGSFDGPYISPLKPDTALSWHHLIRKPVIRQWLYDGK